MEQLGSHWTDFPEILYLAIFRKFIENIRVPLTIWSLMTIIVVVPHS
jgi:hypothetical protein